MAPEVDEADGDVDTCEIAMEAALEKGMGYCKTDEARIETLCHIVGLEGTDRDFDTSGILEDGPGAGAASVQTRQWVVARANGLVTDGSEPYEAINEAWRDVSDELGGGDGEGEEEEPEADAEADDE
ncbi:hypothetical protein [Natronomonas sp.]|uniref:hypothetical protein n=1 Tax=Natronomonas sp. TaxID=2184060 RepID=UPI002FC3011C